MSVSKIRLATFLALSALLIATGQKAQAADVFWIGSSSDITDGANWDPGLPGAADAAQFDDSTPGYVHNLTLDSDLLPLAQRININKTVTAPYSITGTGNLSLASGTGSGYILNAGDFDITVDTASLTLQRSALLTAGDWTADVSDHGTGAIVIGHNGGSMTFNVGQSTSATNSQTPKFTAQYGTDITVYPTVNFNSPTTGTRGLSVNPSNGSTIALYGGVAGGVDTALKSIQAGVGSDGDGNPFTGTMILGSSPTFAGLMGINDAQVVITANDSLGDPSDSAYTEVNRTGVGALVLSNGINTPEFTYLDTRDSYAPHLNNMGTNEMSGTIELEQGSSSPLPENIWTVVNGSSSTDQLTLSGTIQSSAGEGSSNAQILALQGAGHGIVSGSMIEQGGHAYGVEKYDSGTWTYATGSSIQYTGPTHVLAGSLIVNGTYSGGGLFTVDSGATLGGSGSINGTVNLSGAIAPGNSPGTMTVGALTLLDGSSANMEMQNTAGLHAPGGGLSDLVDVTGLLQIAAGNPTITINASAVGGGLLGTGAGGTWTLASYATSSVLSTPTWVINGIAAGYSAAIDLSTPNQVNLVLTAVPEPSTFVLAGLGIVGLVAVRARKRK